MTRKEQEDVFRLTDKAIKLVQALNREPKPPECDLSHLEGELIAEARYVEYKYIDDDCVDDVSYVLCIQNLFGKYKRDKSYENDVISAFRNESHVGTKKKYFIEHTAFESDKFYGKCSNCDTTTSDITTDHYPIPFKNTFNSFLEVESLNLKDIDIYENTQHEIRFKNDELAKKWLSYHDMHAKYRLLCKNCNSKLGSYGY